MQRSGGTIGDCVKLAEKPALTRIMPTKGWASLRLGDIWQYRELLYFLTWRDIKVRYKQTIIGGAWAILQPFITMVIFSVFFGRLLGVPSEGIPYPLFVYSAMIVWTFFANGVGMASTSLVAEANMIKKVYFPRMVLPLSSILSGMLDFLLAFIVLVGMMIYYGRGPTLAVLFLPLFLLLALVSTVGVALWLSALNVMYRDVKYAVPFLMQAWLFATPIAYPSGIISSSVWKMIYGINPMAGVVEGFRWVLLGMEARIGPMIAVSSGMAVLILVGGAYFFRRTERIFADVV
ncbi:MAG: ABC transporter permease [Actinobacteria bacterium]|nr:ABC transporter permease [Actinomycetota bacterium]